MLSSLLPAAMRRELLCESRGVPLKTTVIFNAWSSLHPRSFERLCCDQFRAQIYYPDDAVFSFGEACYRVIFVHAGTFGYQRYSPALGKLFEGRVGGKVK